MRRENTFEIAGRSLDSGWLIAGAFFAGVLALAGAMGGFLMLGRGLGGSEPVQIEAANGSTPGLTNSGASALAPPPIPDKPIVVEDYKPQLAMTAGPKGAFVRAGPSKKGDPMTQLKPGAPLNISGRVKDGDHNWYRLTLDDGRTGFVRDDVVDTILDPTPGAKKPAFAETVEDFTPEASMAVSAGGARIRATPNIKSQALVVLPAATSLVIDGRVDMQDHYWYRVKLTDGRVGYIRDDVVTSPSRRAGETPAPAPPAPPGQ